MICDFCHQTKAKVFIDCDRLICESCLSLYLTVLRNKIISFAGKVEQLKDVHKNDLLVCDLCDFETTSRIKFFNHLKNHNETESIVK